MPEEPEKSGSEPNLELPSLFGRGRKKKRRNEKASPAETAPAAADPEAEPTAGPADAPGTGTPTESGQVEPTVAAGPRPVEGSTRRLPPTPPPPVREAEDTAPVQATAPPVEPAVEPVPDPVPVEPTPQPMPEPEPVPAPPAPEPTPPAPEPEPVPPAPEPVPVPAEPAPATPEPPAPQPAPVGVEQTTVLPGPVPLKGSDEAGEPVGPPLVVEEEPGRRRAPRERTAVALPRINPRVAALVTGLVVGLVGVVLSFGASQGCESVRGVGSCGGIGLVALLAVLAIEVLLGSILLRAWGLTDPTSTSFLAVGLVAVLALLFFLSSLESPWMLLVIPVLTALTFLLSWWVTETFVEQGAGDDLHR